MLPGPVPFLFREGGSQKVSPIPPAHKRLIRATDQPTKPSTKDSSGPPTKRSTWGWGRDRGGGPIPCSGFHPVAPVPVPNGHHPPPPPPPPLDDDDDDPSDENVSEPNPPPPPSPPPPPPENGSLGALGGAVLPINPPAVGGAVGSTAPACSYMSGVGNGGLIILVNMIPMPSMRARRTPPTTAAEAAALGPARAARTPPVTAPEVMEFQGSSFCLMLVNVQSQHANSPPQTANCPPRTGPRAAMAVTPPCIRLPFGALRLPLMT
mmetsp:Transcript_31063/g.63567  ORF Transcript_31063/g.63567 Transcript_31063/m.63567 type:complete len:265 (-) Transcript_31063:230-1024(-)